MVYTTVYFVKFLSRPKDILASFPTVTKGFRIRFRNSEEEEWTFQEDGN